MRRNLYILALVLLAHLSAATGTSAANSNAVCPAVRIECVGCGTLVSQGDQVTLIAKVASGLDSNSQPMFNWSLSAGTITGGQGTNNITIDTTGQGSNTITVTVEIGGLKTTCPSTASFTIEVNVGCILPRKFDEFGDINFEDEKARLANFAIQLMNEPGAVGYIIVYAGRRARIREAERQLERAKNYLVNQHGIAASRLEPIDGGYREDLTIQLWILPDVGPRLNMVDPSSTIDPSEVEIIPDTPQRTRRRGRNR